jgi:hypothetical protein
MNIREANRVRAEIPWPKPASWAIEFIEDDGDAHEIAVGRNERGMPVAFMHPDDYRKMAEEETR